jgi:hypothetical protein
VKASLLITLSVLLVYACGLGGGEPQPKGKQQILVAKKWLQVSKTREFKPDSSDQFIKENLGNSRNTSYRFFRDNTYSILAGSDTLLAGQWKFNDDQTKLILAVDHEDALFYHIEKLNEAEMILTRKLDKEETVRVVLSHFK